MVSLKKIDENKYRWYIGYKDYFLSGIEETSDIACKELDKACMSINTETSFDKQALRCEIARAIFESVEYQLQSISHGIYQDYLYVTANATTGMPIASLGCQTSGTAIEACHEFNTAERTYFPESEVIRRYEEDQRRRRDEFYRRRDMELMREARMRIRPTYNIDIDM